MRGKRVVAALVLGTAAAVAGAGPAGAITGGTAVSRLAYGYFVNVDTSNSKCGGTLIGGDWVLTAAHCVDDDVSKIQVYYDNGTVDRASLVIRHPLWDGDKDDGHDLAVILMPTHSAWPYPSIQAGSPWDAGATAPGTPALIMGTGDTLGAGDGFRTTPTAVVDDTTMDDIYNPWWGFDGWNNALMIGAGAPGHTACKGDSGSPLVVTRNGRPVQIGVASFARDDCDHADGYSELTGPQLAWLASVVPAVAAGWGPCPVPGGGRGIAAVSYGAGPASLPSDGPNRYGIACVPAPPSQTPATVFTNAADGLLWETTVDGTTRRVANGLGAADGSTPAVAAPAAGRVIAFRANVISTGEDDAVRAMTAAGLANGGVTTQNTCTDPAGTVLTQNPQPGPHVLTPGAPFTLTVTSGTDAKGRPCVLR